MSAFSDVMSTAPATFRMPTPYPDELLYSVTARAACRNAHWSPKGLMAAVFGDRAVLACPDLPSQLGLLADAAGQPWKLPVPDIALRYTLAGYYTHYLGSTERDRVLGLMAGKAKHLQLRLGICSGVVRAPRAFFLCPACTELDIQQHGETYWRRSHHLPGVLVCPVHAVSLVETVVPFRGMGRHEHLHARAQHLTEGVPILTGTALPVPELHALAQAAARLLDADVCDAGPLHDYRQPLHARGFKGTSGVEGLKHCLKRYWGTEALQRLFRGSLGTHPTWLWEVLRKPRRPLHPLKHLLIERILLTHEVRVTKQASGSGKTWRIFKDPDLRQRANELSEAGLTVHAVASRLGVDWKTAYRLLQPLPVEPVPVSDDSRLRDRESWGLLMQRYPAQGRTYLRRQAPALYTRLYRHDRDWLMRQGERQARSAGELRVAWPARDASLAQSVQACAMAIKKIQPLRRASVSHVLGLLGARTLVSRNRDKLALTQAALAEHCESVENFQVRRIQAEQEADGWFPRPLGYVMRAAGLNPARFPDGGLGIVTRAQQLREGRYAKPPAQGE